MLVDKSLISSEINKPPNDKDNKARSATISLFFNDDAVFSFNNAKTPEDMIKAPPNLKLENLFFCFSSILGHKSISSLNILFSEHEKSIILLSKSKISSICPHSI